MTTDVRPRILHVLNDLNRLTLGGVGTYLKSAIESTVSDTFDLRVAGIGGGERPHWMRGVDYQGGDGSDFRARIEFAHWLMRNVRRYAIVHLHLMGWPLGLGAPVCLVARVPYIVSVHGGLLTCHEQRDRQRRESIKLALLARSAALVATSERDLPALGEVCPGVRAVLVPPSLCISELTARISHKGSALRLLFVGRLQPFKDVRTLLASVGILRDRGISVSLDVVGAGDADYEKQLHQDVHALSIESHVTFRGHLEGSALQSAYAQADVFVLSSTGENFSFVTAEAMSCGLPVVVSEAVALADVVRRTDSGQIVPVGDAAALADALASYQDPALIAKQGANARSAAVREFSPSAMGLALSDLYASVMAASRGAR